MKRLKHKESAVKPLNIEGEKVVVEFELSELLVLIGITGVYTGNQHRKDLERSNAKVFTLNSGLKEQLLSKIKHSFDDAFEWQQLHDIANDKIKELGGN